MGLGVRIGAGCPDQAGPSLFHGGGNHFRSRRRSRGGVAAAGGAAAALAAVNLHAAAEQPGQQARAFARLAARIAAALAAAGRGAAAAAARSAAGGAALRLAAGGAALRLAAGLAAAGIIVDHHRHLAADLAADSLFHTMRNALLDRARHRSHHRVGDLAMDRVGLHLAHGVRHLFAHGIALHLAHGIGDFLDAVDRHHMAASIRHFFAVLFHHGAPDRIGHFLDAVFLDHAASGVGVNGTDSGAFLEGPALGGAIVANALGIHPGAADAAGHGVGDRFLDHLGHHALAGVLDGPVELGAFLEDAAFTGAVVADALGIDVSTLGHAANGVGDFLDHRLRHALAHRVGDLGVDAFADIGGAGHLLVDHLGAPDLAGAHLGRLLAANRGSAAAHVRAAGAGVEAAFAAFLANGVAAARTGEGLNFPLAAALLHGLHDLDRLADHLAALLVAGLDAILPAGHAALLDVGLLQASAHVAGDGLAVDLAHRPADGVAAFLAVLLAQLLTDHVAAFTAVLLVNRAAHRVVALFLAALGHLAADLVAALFPPRLIHRFAAGVVAIFPAGFVHRLAAGLQAILVTGAVAGAVAGLGFVAVTGLAHLPVDRFVHGLIAGVPAFFHHRVPDQLVAYSALLLAGRKTALRVATGPIAATILGGTAVLRGRRWHSHYQAGQGHH